MEVINSWYKYKGMYSNSWAFQTVLVVNNPPANARDIRDMGSIHGSRSSFGGGHGNLLHNACLENPMDRSLAGYSP